MSKYIFYPPFLILLIGLTSVIINITFFETSLNVIFMFVCGIFFFILAYIVSDFIFNGKIILRNQYNTNLHVNNKYLKISNLVSFFAFILASYIIYNYGIKPGGAIFLNLRYRHTILGESSLGIQYFSLFPFVSCILYIIKDKYLKAGCFFCVYLLCSLSIAERTSILFILVTIIMLLFFKKKINVKMICMFISFFFFLSTVIAISANKLGKGDHNFIVEYIGYGITAFNIHILPLEPTWCVNYLIGSYSKFLPFQTCELELNLYNGEFNVFSYLYGPYLFGGEIFIYISMFFLGLFYWVIFNLQRKSHYFLYPSAMLIYPLIMIFYDWQFPLITPLYISLLLIPSYFKLK